MKKSRVIEILIIIFILIIGSICLNSIYYRVFVKPNLYTITFTDIDSIIKGSPVRFMGIIVGHVRQLKRDEGQIFCEIVVTKPNMKIPDGALAKVEFNGLAGSKSIEIMPPKTEDPNVKGIVSVETHRINDFGVAFENLREVAACVKEFVYGITPQSALSATKAISEFENTGTVELLLDEAVKNQRIRKKKFEKFFELQKIITDLNKKF